MAAALVTLFVSAACGHLPWSGGNDLTAAACPAAAVLRPLAGTAIFGKPDMEMRPTDVMYYGVLSEIDAKCAVNGDTLQASLDIIVAAERGPATKADSVDLTYFLAVVGPNDSILSKTSYGVHVDVPRDSKRGAVNDHIDLTVPLRGLAPSALQIVVGFQQTPQVVDFYQHFRGR
ncbi:MAG TPA: hypothetical protein VFW46_20250 [Stellaceae bacterium]|nr:hypothetical protein [Stellaceae bacterium]